MDSESIFCFQYTDWLLCMISLVIVIETHDRKSSDTKIKKTDYNVRLVDIIPVQKISASLISST